MIIILLDNCPFCDGGLSGLHSVGLFAEIAPWYSAPSVSTTVPSLFFEFSGELATAINLKIKIIIIIKVYT